MNVRHVTEMGLDLSNRKCLVVGKGPSFSSRVITEYKVRHGLFMCALNNAWTAADICWDLCVFSDWPITKYFINCDNVYYFACGTRKCNPDVDFLHSMANVEKFKDRLYFFDNEGKHKYRFFTNHDPFMLHTAIVETAVELLARLGAREFYFCGVDGTTDHHKAFEPRTSKFPLEGQFVGLAELEQKYGLTYVGLPDVYNTYRQVQLDRSIKQ